MFLKTKFDSLVVAVTLRIEFLLTSLIGAENSETESDERNDGYGIWFALAHYSCQNDVLVSIRSMK